MLRRLGSAAMLLLLPLAQFSAAEGTDPEREPLELGLVEEVERPLAQIHVTVSGPLENMIDLGPQDFRLRIRGIPVYDFTVDRLSTPVGSDRPAVDGGLARRPASYLFYFDQPLLKPYGRRRALDLARDLVVRLVTDASRGMVVSNGKSLEVYAHLTSDTGELLEAIDRVEQDVDQQDIYAAREESRIAELADAAKDARVAGGMWARFFNRHLQPGGGGAAGAKSGGGASFSGGSSGSGSSTLELNPLAEAQDYYDQRRNQNSLVNMRMEQVRMIARHYHRDESWRAQIGLQRLRGAMAHLYPLEPPKSVLYFADIFRINPGEHYLKFFGEAEGIADTRPYLDDLLNDAAANKILFFTVQAGGLVTHQPGRPFIHLRDAQEGLSSLAAYTGGRAFLHGVEASRITDTITRDYSNTYLISFDPTDFGRDEVLPVRLKIKRPGLQIRYRGRVVLQSGEERRASKLFAAFAAPQTAKSDFPVRSLVIPTGYRDGTFSALVQVGVATSGTAESTWDLGATVVARGKVRETSARMSVATAGAPIILQQPMEFAPGPYEIVAVAYNLTTDGIASRQVAGSWPRPRHEPATVGPIAVVQPSRAAIRRDGELRTSGAVAYAEDEPIRVDRPTALLSVICRDPDREGVLQVERDLAGDSAVPFPTTAMDPGEERCALIQDLIPADTMTGGGFRYEIRIVENGEVIASGERSFLAWDGRLAARR